MITVAVVSRYFQRQTLLPSKVQVEDTQLNVAVNIAGSA